MARNTLGMILAGLGGGLTGYGQERERKAQREEEARRREFSEASAMLGMGYEPEAMAKTRSERVGQALQQAGRVAGTAPSMPGMPGGALQSALMQAAQVAPQAEMTGGSMFEAGGRRYVQRASRTPEAIKAQERMLLTADEIAREERGEASKMRFLEAQTKADIKEQQARAQTAGRQAGLSPNDRAYQATLQYARTAIPDENDPSGMTRRMPTPEEVQAFAANAKAAESSVYGTPAPANAGSRVVTDMQRADRYEELRRQGMSPEAAQAQVLREMPR